MNGTLRVLVKDLVELMQGWRGSALVFLVPPIALMLVGQLRTETDPVRLLVAVNQDSLSQRQSRQLEELVRTLQEIASLQVTVRQQVLRDPLETLETEDFDLLLEVDDPTWLLYTAETDTNQLPSLEQLAGGIERALALISSRSPRRTRALDVGEELDSLVENLAAAGLVTRLRHYYPAIYNRGDELLPKTIALLLCFLPFVLTAPSLIRERQARTLEALLAAPPITPRALFWGRCGAAVSVTYFHFLAMLVLAQLMYGVLIKSGLPGVVLLITPAILSSTFLGIVVSTLARSQSQSFIWAAVYFLTLALFSDVLYPINESSWIIRGLSTFSPLTFIHGWLNAWMLGAGLGRNFVGLLLIVTAQALFFGGLAWWSFRRFLRRV